MGDSTPKTKPYAVRWEDGITGETGIEPFSLPEGDDPDDYGREVAMSHVTDPSDFSYWVTDVEQAVA